MVQPQHDVAHYIGTFLKWVAILAVFAVTATLSYGFFSSITPPSAPWFPIAGLSLTEGGMALWLATLRLQRHHDFNSSVSLIMAAISGFTACLIAGYELYALIAARYTLADFPWVFQIMALLIPIMLIAHVAVFVVEIIHGNFEMPGRNFRAPQPVNLIPKNSHVGNFNSQLSHVSVEELQSALNVVTGYLVAARGGSEDTDPLAGRALPVSTEDGSNQEANMMIANVLDSVGKVANRAGQAVSTLKQKRSGATKSGKTAGRVPGQTNETTAASGLQNENEGVFDTDLR